MTAPPLPHRLRLWRACRPDFGPDGSAQRIYVLEIGEAEWDALLRAVPRGPWPHRFSLDDLTAPLPKYGIEAFAAWRQAAPLLELAVGPAVVRCRFGSVQQLELELDPAEVGDPDALEALVRLMAWLGRLLRRSVVLAPDDAPERPILEYDDATRRVRFHAAAAP
jgi:hypothetical protein